MQPKTSKRYNDSFKRRVVFEVLSGSLTKEEARRRYNIGGNSTILDWMRAHAGLQMNAPGADPVPILRAMNTRKDTAELEAKIEQLQAQLEYAQLKGRAYEIMVEIAKDSYGLDLKKKSGHRPSKHSRRSVPK